MILSTLTLSFVSTSSTQKSKPPLGHWKRIRRLQGETMIIENRGISYPSPSFFGYLSLQLLGIYRYYPISFHSTPSFFPLGIYHPTHFLDLWITDVDHNRETIWPWGGELNPNAIENHKVQSIGGAHRRAFLFISAILEQDSGIWRSMETITLCPGRGYY